MAAPFLERINLRITNFLTSDVVRWGYRLLPRAAHDLFFTPCRPLCPFKHSSRNIESTKHTKLMGNRCADVTGYIVIDSLT